MRLRSGFHFHERVILFMKGEGVLQFFSWVLIFHS